MNYDYFSKLQGPADNLDSSVHTKDTLASDPAMLIAEIYLSSEFNFMLSTVNRLNEINTNIE